MQVLTTALPNGRPIHVQYDAIAHAALEMYHAGRVMGEVPNGKRGEPGRIATEAYEKARKRAEDTRNKLEETITDAMAKVVADTWDAAMGSVYPFKCGHCGERFGTMQELIAHATERDGPDMARAECCKELEMSLRLASSWSKPATNNG